MKLLSWNINGIRAAEKKGFREFIENSDADVICLQETKAQPDQIPMTLTHVPGWHVWFHSAERKGYSGTAIYSKIKPVHVDYGLGQSKFDSEGRTIIADFDDFLLYNIYFPNGGSGETRLDYKLRFYECFHDHVLSKISEGRQIIVCGDFNTAHNEIDIARPKENVKVSGFMPIERAFLDRFVESGFVDTFRRFNQYPGQYTWWDTKSRARDRNIGWRLDYFFVSMGLADRVRDAFIQMDVMGSDHCPAGVEIG